LSTQHHYIDIYVQQNQYVAVHYDSTAMKLGFLLYWAITAVATVHALTSARREVIRDYQPIVERDLEDLWKRKGGGGSGGRGGGSSSGYVLNGYNIRSVFAWPSFLSNTFLSSVVAVVVAAVVAEEAVVDQVLAQGLAGTLV
jgi:hypothetical protein